MLWEVLFLALMFQDGESRVGLGPLTIQGGPPKLIYLSYFLITTPLMWDLPILHLQPSYHSQRDFFISLLIRILFR